MLLNNHRVEYLLAGGYAVAAHRYPRFTGDLDIWIKPVLENARKVIQVLSEYGMGSVEINEEDLTQP